MASRCLASGGARSGSLTSGPFPSARPPAAGCSQPAPLRQSSSSRRGERTNWRFPLGRVVNRGGRVGRKSLAPAGAEQSADGRSTVRVAIGSIIGSYEQCWQSRLARCYGQRPAPRALILQAMRERLRGQIERWRTLRVALPLRERHESAVGRHPRHAPARGRTRDGRSRPRTRCPVAHGRRAHRPRGEALPHRHPQPEAVDGERGRKRAARRPVGSIGGGVLGRRP